MKYFLLVCILFGTAFAGSTAGDFMANPISVRSVGLGGCTATQLDSTAFFKNPSAGKAYGHQSVQLLQGKIFSDINYLSLNYVNPNFTPLNLGFGFSFLHTGVDGIPEATYDKSTGTAELTGSTFSYQGAGYVCSLSAELTNNWFAGINLKHVRESLYSQSGSGSGLDIGTLYQGKNWSAGLSIINAVKPLINWDTGSSEPINTELRTGISYLITPELNLLVEAQKIAERPNNALGGIEYRPFRFFAFRIGHGQNKTSLGTGLYYDNLVFDYAYVDNQDKEVGLTQYFSIALLLDAKPADLAIQPLNQAVQKEQQEKQVDQKQLAFENPQTATSSAQLSGVSAVKSSENIVIKEIFEKTPPNIILLSPSSNVLIIDRQTPVTISVTDSTGISLNTLKVYLRHKETYLPAQGLIYPTKNGYLVNIKPEGLYPAGTIISIIVSADDLYQNKAKKTYEFKTAALLLSSSAEFITATASINITENMLSVTPDLKSNSATGNIAATQNKKVTGNRADN